MSLSAVVTFANLAVLLVATMFILGRVEGREYHDARVAIDEVGQSMFVAVMVQLAANGMVLATLKRTRRLGLGLVVGTLAALAVLAGLVFLFVVTVGS